MPNIDLSAIQKKLGGKSRFSGLSKAIKEYSSFSSAWVDLEKARKCVELAMAYAAASVKGDMAESGSQDPDQALTAGALVQHAIVLYARATTTNSNHRIYPLMVDLLPEDLVADHRIIEHLRDDGVAHFGPGSKADDQSWAKGRAVMHLDLEAADLQVEYAFQSANWRSEAVRKLDQLITATMAIAEEQIARKKAGVIVAFAACLKKHGPELKKFTADNEFNPLSFFGDQESADHFAEVLKGASRQGVARYQVDGTRMRTTPPA